MTVCPHSSVSVIPAWTAGIQLPWKASGFAVLGTGYPLPGGYDEVVLDTGIPCRYDGLPSFVGTRHSGMDCRNPVAMEGSGGLPSLALDTRFPAGMTRCFGLARTPVIPAIHAGMTV